jgi:hypothetical protein
MYGSNADRLQRALDQRVRSFDSQTSGTRSRLSHASSVSVLDKPAHITRHPSLNRRATAISIPTIQDYSNYRFSAQSGQSRSSVPSSDSSTDSRSISSVSDSSSYTARLHSSPKRLFETSNKHNEAPGIVLATPSRAHQLLNSCLQRSRDTLEDLQEESYVPVSIGDDLDIDQVLSSAIATSVGNKQHSGRKSTQRPNSLQFLGQDRRPSYMLSLPGEPTMSMGELQSPTFSTRSDSSIRKMSIQIGKFSSQVRRFAKKIAV